MHFKILEINFLEEKSGKVFLKPDRSRILKPDIRPEPDSAGYPVGSYQCTSVSKNIKGARYKAW